MPFAIRDGVRLYWRLDGDDAGIPLVLLNSIGTDMTMWDGCMSSLSRRFAVLRMDARGHGASDAPGGDYDLEMLAADVVAVMQAAGLERAAIAGVSLGGMVAMRLALEHAERVDALALICTSALMDVDVWAERVKTVRKAGTASIADLAIRRFLSPAFMDRHPQVSETLRRGLVAMADDGYAGAGAAIRDMELVARLSEIRARTLVVAGGRDVSTPFEEHGALIAATVPRCSVVHVDAAHLAPIEAPAKVAALLLDFMASRGGVDAALDAVFEEGLSNRRRILGDAWVDRSLATRTSFNAEFQAMITRVAWAEIWGRPGLDDRTRRLIVVAITASLGRWEEFRLHVRTGLARGGFERDELKEVLMQTSVYAGVPAANTAFAEAGLILAELDDAAD